MKCWRFSDKERADEPSCQLLGNSPMESFFKTLEVERVYQLRYQDRATTRVDIVHLDRSLL